MGVRQEIPRKTSVQIDFGPYGEKLRKQIGSELKRTQSDQVRFDFSQPTVNELFSSTVEQQLVIAFPGGTAMMKDLTGELGENDFTVSTVFGINSKTVGKFDAGVSLRLETAPQGLILVGYDINVPTKRVDPRRAGFRKLLETGVKAADVRTILTEQVDEQLLTEVNDWGVEHVMVSDRELHTIFERSN